jgi:hypothetical protein
MLTKEEKLVCELYINGEPPYVGDIVECYSKVFNDKSEMVALQAQTFVQRTDIKDYIEELETANLIEAKHLKRFLTKNLVSIVKEASHATYFDRKGRVQSPAAMRSVAVNAAKALMDMHPIKEAQISKISLDSGEGGSGITFNVIVPSAPAKTTNKDD